jgi:hypothetical protein
MIPSKGRRKIVVEDKLYFYSVSGRNSATITIVEQGSNKLVQHNIESSHVQITPKLVAELVRDNFLK